MTNNTKSERAKPGRTQREISDREFEYERELREIDHELERALFEDSRDPKLSEHGPSRAWRREQELLESHVDVGNEQYGDCE